MAKNNETGILEPFKVDPKGKLKFKECINLIMNSVYFRKLADKTQVIISLTGPNVRTRLTHTVEVAKIARDMCEELGLNKDLAEAIALAHDIGHTPFGHVGERTLMEIMCGCDTLNNTIEEIKPENYGFKHNLQSALLVNEILRKKNLKKELSYIFWGVAAHSSMTYTKRDSGFENEILIHCDHCKNVFSCKFSDSPDDNQCKFNLIGNIIKKKKDKLCYPWICSRIYDKSTIGEKSKVEKDKLKEKTKCEKPCFFVDVWSYRRKNIKVYQYFDYLFDYPFCNYYYLDSFSPIISDGYEFISFEAVVVSIADEIAQRRQDFEDGIQQKLIDLKEGVTSLEKLIGKSRKLCSIQGIDMIKPNIDIINMNKARLKKLSIQILMFENELKANINKIDKLVNNSDEFIKDFKGSDVSDVEQIVLNNKYIKDKTKIISNSLKEFSASSHSDYMAVRQKTISELGNIIVDFLKAIYCLKIKKKYIEDEAGYKNFKPNNVYKQFFEFMVEQKSKKKQILFEELYENFQWENILIKDQIDKDNLLYFLDDYLKRSIMFNNNKLNEKMVNNIDDIVGNKHLIIDPSLKGVNLINIQEIKDQVSEKNKHLKEYMSNIDNLDKPFDYKNIYFDDLDSMEFIKFLNIGGFFNNGNDTEKLNDGFNKFKHIYKSNANQPLMRFVDFDKKIDSEKDFKDAIDTFEKFYRDLILKSELVEKNDGKSAFVIKRLFKGYLSNPHQLQDKAIERIWQDILPRFFNKRELKRTFKSIHYQIKVNLGTKFYPKEKEITFDKPEPDNPAECPKEIREFGKAIKKLKENMPNASKNIKTCDIRKIIDNPILIASNGWKQALYRGITDHIAGLTDREALLEYEKLYYTTVEVS